MASSMAALARAGGVVGAKAEEAWDCLVTEFSEKVTASGGGGFWAFLSSLQTVLVTIFGHHYFGNEYFIGSLGMMLITFVAGSAKRVIQRLYEYIVTLWNSQLVSVYVPEDGEVYKWVSEWLAVHSTRVTSKWNLECDWEGEGAEENDGISEEEFKPQLFFVPNLKKEALKIKYRGNDLSFEVDSKGKMEGGDGDGGESRDDMVANLFNARAKTPLLIRAKSRAIIEELVKEAMEISYEKLKTKTKTIIYRWDANTGLWNTVVVRPVRERESLILTADFDNLVADAREFIGGRDWYRSRGVPYRRGYLLHGPPGTGKSSTILVLAGVLKLDLSIIGLSDKYMDDHNLRSALNLAPIRSILVLEDIDAAFSGRRSDEARGNSLSFSGLLNAIDGVAAQEGKLLVMTTNYAERLDAALIRPGRCDLKMYLGLADRQQTVGMFHRFYPDAPAEKAVAFGSVVPEGVATTAFLQSYFLQHRNDSDAALARVPDLLMELEKGKTAAAPAPASASASDPPPCAAGGATTGVAVEGERNTEIVVGLSTENVCQNTDNSVQEEPAGTTACSDPKGQNEVSEERKKTSSDRKERDDGRGDPGDPVVVRAESIAQRLAVDILDLVRVTTASLTWHGAAEVESKPIAELQPTPAKMAGSDLSDPVPMPPVKTTGSGLSDPVPMPPAKTAGSGLSDLVEVEPPLPICIESALGPPITATANASSATENVTDAASETDSEIGTATTTSRSITTVDDKDHPVVNEGVGKHVRIRSTGLGCVLDHSFVGSPVGSLKRSDLWMEKMSATKRKGDETPEDRSKHKEDEERRRLQQQQQNEIMGLWNDRHQACSSPAGNVMMDALRSDGDFSPLRLKLVQSGTRPTDPTAVSGNGCTKTHRQQPCCCSDSSRNEGARKRGEGIDGVPKEAVIENEYCTLRSSASSVSGSVGSPPGRMMM